jgi:hypothetical protein
MKGNSSCHCPNNEYRDGWDRIWKKKLEPEEICPECGGKLEVTKSIIFCSVCMFKDNLN